MCRCRGAHGSDSKQVFDLGDWLDVVRKLEYVIQLHWSAMTSKSRLSDSPSQLKRIPLICCEGVDKDVDNCRFGDAVEDS